MYKSVEQALLSCRAPWPELDCHVLVREDPDTSGQFLTTAFLSSLLTGGRRRVLFVSLHHTFGHFSNIAARAGTNLLAYYKTGHVKVIEGQRLLTEAAAKVLEGQDVSKHPFSFVFNDGDKSLKNLYLLIRFSVNEWRQSNTPFTIIIDNLSNLLSFGLLPTEVILFINYCHSLLSLVDGGPSSCSPKPNFLGSLIVSTVDDALDQEAKRLACSLAHDFDITLSVSALSTGRSPEVDGVLNIFNWPQKNRTEPPVCKTLHYKVQEKDVQLFAPGMAASVL